MRLGLELLSPSHINYIQFFCILSGSPPPQKKTNKKTTKKNISGKHKNHNNNNKKLLNKFPQLATSPLYFMDDESSCCTITVLICNSLIFSLYPLRRVRVTGRVCDKSALGFTKHGTSRIAYDNYVLIHCMEL